MHRPSSVPSSYSHSRQACRWAVELAGQLFPPTPALIFLVAPCSSQSPRPATRQTAARQASSSSPTRKGESIHLSLTPTPAPTLTQKYRFFQPMRHQLPSRRLVTTTTTITALPRYEISPPTAHCLFPRHSEGALGTKKTFACSRGRITCACIALPLDPLHHAHISFRAHRHTKSTKMNNAAESVTFVILPRCAGLE